MLTVDMHTHIPPAELSDLADRYDYGGFALLSRTAAARFRIP